MTTETTVSTQWRETQYGFVWGGLEFQRLFSDDDGRVCARIGGVGTDNYVEVYVSPKGRSVRAFLRGVKPEGDV